MTKHTGAMTDGRMFVVEGEYRGRKMVQRDGVDSAYPEEERQKKWRQINGSTYRHITVYKNPRW